MLGLVNPPTFFPYSISSLCQVSSICSKARTSVCVSHEQENSRHNRDRTIFYKIIKVN